MRLNREPVPASSSRRPRSAAAAVASRLCSVVAWPMLAGLLLGLVACAGDDVTERAESAQGRGAADAPAQALPGPGGVRMEIIPSPQDPFPALPSASGVPNDDTVILTPPPGVHRAVPVGLLLPLSGNAAPVGRALLASAQLALFDVAAEDFVLLPRDTGGTPQGASAAAISAIGDGARLLLGPLFAASVIEVAPLARAANLSLVAFSNDRAAARDDAFVLGFRPEAAVHRVVGFAATKGRRRLAALVPDDAYGARIADALRAAAAQSGATVVAIERYRQDSESASAAVQRLGRLGSPESRPYDAVLLAESGAALKSLAPLLPFYDIDTRKIRILGVDGRPGTELEREPALSGAWFAGPSPDARKSFEARYRAVYGRAPHPLGPLAYDAAALAAVLAAQPGGPDFSSRALTAPNGFAGTAGTFRLLPHGLVERQLAVIELRPAGAVVVSPARDSFQPLGN